MNFYVDVINQAVNYIEDNIGEKLSLSQVSEHFTISDFHFNRMFKTVIGITLKQYILGRKLTMALGLLKETNRTIIDIAMDLGFEYPEVFSRAFKKQFGVSPNQFRDNSMIIDGIPKATMIERNIINYKGTLVLKGNSVFLEEFCLVGISLEVDINDDNFEEKLKTESEQFVLQSLGMDCMYHDMFYTVVNCHGSNNGEYTVFCGKEPIQSDVAIDFYKRTIPGGWYIEFQYNGDMFDIRETFVDDLYRWIIVNEAELNSNGIGMINIYKSDYPENSGVKILIPIKKYNQQEMS